MMTDSEFLDAFERGVLPPGQWKHSAHVRMAWLYLQRGSLVEMLPIVRAGIQRYNASLDKPLAYHETITQGFMILIYMRLASACADETFADFCARNSDLLDSTLTALLEHYRRETLFSPEARETFVTPDLRPFTSGSEPPLS